MRVTNLKEIHVNDIHVYTVRIHTHLLLSMTFTYTLNASIQVRLIWMWVTSLLPCCWNTWCYGVATVSRIDEIIGLFCKRDLSNRQYSAKETYHFIDPTDRSHPIVTLIHTPRHISMTMTFTYMTMTFTYTRYAFMQDTRDSHSYTSTRDSYSYTSNLIHLYKVRIHTRYSWLSFIHVDSYDRDSLIHGTHSYTSTCINDIHLYTVRNHTLLLVSMRFTYTRYAFIQVDLYE